MSSPRNSYQQFISEYFGKNPHGDLTQAAEQWRMRKTTKNRCTTRYNNICKKRTPTRECHVNKDRRSCRLLDGTHILVGQPGYGKYIGRPVGSLNKKKRSPSKKQVRSRKETLSFDFY